LYTVVFLFFCLHDFRLDQHIGLEEIAKYDEEAKADANILLKEIIRYAKKAEIPVTKHSYQWIENTYKTNYSYGEYFLQSLNQRMNTPCRGYQSLKRLIKIRNTRHLDFERDS